MATGTYKTWANISVHTVLSKKMIVQYWHVEKRLYIYFLIISPIGMQIQVVDFHTIKFESTRYKVPYKA